jgi:Peptidase family S51
MNNVTLLGPQRHQPFVKEVLDDQGIEGPLAVITGGWEEREDEVDDLREHIHRDTVNLGLFRRLEEVRRQDKPFAAAVMDRNDRLRAAQTFYRLRLASALSSVRKLNELKVSHLGLKVSQLALLPAERSHALKAVSQLDGHYLKQIRGIHEAFQDFWNPEERPGIAETREEIKAALEGCSGLLIAGGNVGTLLDQLYLLRVGPLLRNLPIVAWSAGAMVLTERVVLFHDSPPQGRGNAEIYDDGLGLVPSVVALPHAAARLRLEDPRRVGIMAERFKPATCVALDEGSGVRWDGVSWTAMGRARRLTSKGKLAGMVAP